MSVTKIVMLFLLGTIGTNFLFAQDLQPLSEVPLLELPQQDNKALQIREFEARTDGRPQQFATRVNISVNPETHGVWETTADGLAVWRFRIRSAKALSLNYGFTEYNMPAGGQMRLYSPDLKHKIRPFTSLDNEAHGQLWTPVLPGEETVLEVRLPAAKRPDLRLQLKYAHHDYVGFGMARPPSGSCNLDVICGAADGWGIVDAHRDIIQAAGAFHMNGSSICSGALINNVRNDCTPFYLTADHCGIGNNNAASVVVYWNYQNSFCRQPNSSASGQPGDGTLTEFNTGSMFRAGYGPSDFTLIELDDPLDATHNPYLAGWNRSRTPATSAIGIHFPGVEEKRISFENDPVSISGWQQPTDSTHVQVNDWDTGTTEGGSSGSPLFDQDDRIIGQLTGGGAACGNNLEDQYGWVAVSWEGGGSPASRLKDWLDPDNTGAMFMNGKSCAYAVTPSPIAQEVCIPSTGSVSYTIAVSGGFATNVTLSVGNLPTGATSAFSTNPVSPGNTSTLTVSNLPMVTPGSYTFNLYGTDGIESDSSDLILTVANAPSTTPALSAPSNGQMAVSAVASFAWGGSSGLYEIEVATDNMFTNIVQTATGLSAAAFMSTPLMSQTTYYWRVRGSNICGMSAWSPVFNFTTDQIDCVNLPATTVPVTIDANGPNTITSTLAYNSTGLISDVNIPFIRGLHSWLSDLTFTLISPQGTRVTLIDQACFDENDFDIGMDDQATGALPCPFNVGGMTTPMQALSAFNGENPMGTWTLEVIDHAYGDGGRLDEWELEICGSLVIATSDAQNAARFRVYPNPAKDIVRVAWLGGAERPEVVNLYSIQGNLIRSLDWPQAESGMEIGLEELSAGFYLLSIEAGAERWIEKVMITR